MTVTIVSLGIGLAAGWLINYAITFRTGQARNFVVCIGAALVGGALIPWALRIPTFWAAVIGSAIALAIVLYIMFRLSLRQST